MPEYPDIELYLSALRRRIQGQRLLSVVQKDPFVLRTVEPSPSSFLQLRVSGLQRLGKRIVLCFEQDLFMIIHLMIAGRFRWTEPTQKPPVVCLMVWAFETGWLALTEAGSKRRAKIHLVKGAEALAEHDPGGLELFPPHLADFSQRLLSRRHTLKRSLTDPTLFSGIGNAYSDEILLRARLSPVRLSTQLSLPEIERLHQAVLQVLQEWRDRLQAEWGEKFPTTVTAFHPGMAAHGKYLQPCPQCGQPIQRICYAANETNYCARCQTNDRLLADRSLSRLLKQDWPRSVDELEDRRQRPP